MSAFRPALSWLGRAGGGPFLRQVHDVLRILKMRGSAHAPDKRRLIIEQGGLRVTVTEQEEQTVARAGVSGPAWAKVWLPRLLEGREEANVRVAPITHSGELLGLIVGGHAHTFTSDRARELAQIDVLMGRDHNEQRSSLRSIFA